MQITRPVALADAVEFAEGELSKGSVFWPRLLVAHMEESKPSDAFRFAVDVYKCIATGQPNSFVLNLVVELKMLVDSQDNNASVLRQRSLEIWEDLSDRSFLKRGVTRLFNALALLIEGRRNEYEVEVTRALQATAENGDGRTGSEGNRWILDKFRKDYGNERDD